MQISRHWRLNSQRYRLEGVRYVVNGEVRLQARVLSPNLLDTTAQRFKEKRVPITTEGEQINPDPGRRK